MKLRFAALSVLGIFLALGALAQAQILYNYLAPDVTANIMRVNQINSNLMMNQMLAQQLAFNHMVALENTGRMRIAAGQANTTFAANPRNSFLTRIDSTHRAAAEKVLEAFQSAMRDKGLKPNDTADGRALAMILAFYGYRGQDPGVKRLIAARESYRKEMLTTPLWQGRTDSSRQEEYERLGYFAIVSVAARNEYQRLAAARDPGAEAARDQAEKAGAAVLSRIFNIPVSGLELDPSGDGFRDAGELIAREGSGNVLFERRGTSMAAATADRVWGAGASARWMERFQRLMQDRRANQNDMVDCWATGYATFTFLRSRGAAPMPSPRAWTAVRDHMRKWALTQPYWMRATDAERQEVCDRIGIEAGRLMDGFEAEQRRQQSHKPANDEIGRIFRTPPPSMAGSIAESAEKAMASNFEAAERPRLEQLIQQR